ncbi:MAG: hypothetical protein CME62_12690 [Halobacteriovoraceae bacterium]|nr:hypothetical protein [Halobacteriovoraceae bacterium]|tara:strand:- start:29456 stop:30487 length:1032 start_codon:yes stop_codon:yes gene_type:complete
MGKETKNIVIVGDGVAAWALAFYLREFSVKIISGAKHNHTCSFNSTSINCLRGTERGVSSLGDLICDSMDEFENFFQTHSPKGVDLGYEYQIWNELDHDKWVRRYPEFLQVQNDSFLSQHIKRNSFYVPNTAYFINPQELRKWLLDHSHAQVQSDFITEISLNKNEYTLNGLNGDYQADMVVLACGFQTRFLTPNTDESFAYYLDHCKPVVGDYLELSHARDHFPKWQESFNFAVGKYHFIYRHAENKIHIGSTSLNLESRELADKDLLRKIYHDVSAQLNFELPIFESFSAHCGVRHKGHKRLPFWGKIDDHKLFSVCGLYKNGFSFSFLAAKELAREISEL